MATSPKRLKREDASLLLDAFTMEPSLVDTILSYVPSTNASDIKKTIANVCLALPTSYRSVLDRVRPSNQPFWRRLVLTSFNFEVDPSKTFNVKGYDGEGAHFYDRDEEIQAIVEEWEQAHEGAQVDEYLLENLAYWQHLEVYFRPSQYGFLRAIQMGELSEDKWPAHEDAFTLFCDLSTLVDEFKFENLRTFSDGDQWMNPCLLSELQKSLGSRNFELLEHCGIAPHYWAHEGPPVWQWAEFGGKMSNDDSVFPLCEEETLPKLKALVATKMCDWRIVVVNREESPAPTFHLGMRKHSKRWIGFVGQRDHY